MTTQQRDFIESCAKRLQMIEEGANRVAEIQNENEQRLQGVDILTEKNLYDTRQLIKELENLKK